MEEKSRRKGRFNIVDIVVILILLAGAAFVGMKFLGSDDPGSAAAPGPRIEYTVLVPAVRAEVCESIMEYKTANVQLMANGELVDGHVVDITYQPHINYEVGDNGEVNPSEEVGENARVDMVFTIQATANNTVTYKVGTQEVRIGKTHIVKTTEFELEGYKDVVVTSRKVIG